MNNKNVPIKQGLYDPALERDSCGVGFVVNINGEKSHLIVERGIEVLGKLLHRGATADDNKTGDGAGILIQIPDAFLRAECKALKISLPAPGHFGVGMIFMPQDIQERARCQEITEQVVAEEGFVFLGWRIVPVCSDTLGKKAKDEQPFMMQCFVCAKDRAISAEVLERKLYIARRQIELRVEAALMLQDRFYIPSFSARTIVYKGLLMGTQLTEFYLDLNASSLVSAFAVIHQRYSTNTFPSWKLAQPFRYLAHNGEINTLRGNLNQMQARERFLKSELLGDDLQKILPVIDPGGSDSACLDNALELLTSCGREIPHAMMMLIPQAWGLKYPIGPDLRGFFEYHAGLMEPWDGPAAVAFSDGLSVGALLDRNGLRPARYTITKDHFMVLASETGVLAFEEENIAEKGALRPGEIILVDLQKKRVIKNKETKTFYTRRQPYRRWVEENKIALHGLFNDVAPVQVDTKKLLFSQKLFGYTREDIDTIIAPMAAKGYEPVGSMGADTPLAVLSEKPQLFFWYFKQLFAQITNPPIDPIREELVMSLMTFMGNPGNILSEIPQNSRLIKLAHPIFSNEDLERIQSLNLEEFWTTTLQMGFSAQGTGGELEEALGQLCRAAEASVANGCSIIILSDRNLSEESAPIPALLAVSAVNQHLVAKGMKAGVDLIVETAEAREVHHMALLLGFGAAAVNPYFAFEIIADLVARKILPSDVPVTKAIENYIDALCKGLLKIMSKMGISTLRSYRGAQIFEAIGLSCDVVERYFTGTASRIEGIGLSEIAAEANARYLSAHEESESSFSVLQSGGQYRYRQNEERHLWTPESISKLQMATRSNDYRLYKEYARLINDQTKKQSTLRGLFNFKKTKSISLDEVEPAEEIMKRFVTSAMSFGSISREVHETLAIAMNRIGARSNSGEGGEDPARYKLLPNGDNRCSAVKQVASGR